MCCSSLCLLALFLSPWYISVDSSKWICFFLLSVLWIFNWHMLEPWFLMPPTKWEYFYFFSEVIPLAISILWPFLLDCLVHWLLFSLFRVSMTSLSLWLSFHLPALLYPRHFEGIDLQLGFLYEQTMFLAWCANIYCA